MGDALRHTGQRVLRSQFRDDPEMAALVEMFLDELGPRIESMRRAWEASDRDSLRRIAHQIKGAAGGYGYPSISEAAHRLEAGLSRGQESTDSIRAALNELIDLCQSALGGRA